MEVWVNRVDVERIDALIRLYRGPDLAVDLRYQILWENMVVEGGNYNVGRLPNPL